MADYAIHDTTLIGISNVIRKKEGSSALIDPAEYADRINLMGMLEEKSASSASVCSFSDGADDVPMSSVIAHIAPTLTGTNAVNMKQTGKNFIDFPNNLTTGTSGGITFSKASNGGISYSGTATGTFAYITPKIDFKIPIGKQFTLSRDTALNFRHYVQLTFSDDTTASVVIDVNNTSVTYTPAKEVIAVRLIMSQLTAQTEYSGTVYVQIEYNSSATDFEAYTATTYTANLGRTVYGADADLVSGQGSENCTNRNLVGEGFTWSYNTIELSFPYFTIGANAPDKASNKNFVCEGYVNNGNYRSVLQDGEIGVFNNTSGINRFCVRDDSCTTLEQFLEKNANTKITYEVTTGTDFTFDGQEIPSLLGVNNLWHDAGETEAVYRSSGTVTPVVPTLISKTITENGTYSAEDDNADGYDEVTVNVEGDEDMNYSTTEHEVGTWIDGSPIYERTFELQSQLTVSSSTWTSSGISADGIAKIMGVELFGVSNYQGGGLANIQNDVIMLQTTRNSDAYVKEFSLRYTKASVSLLSMSPSPTPSEPDSEDPEEEVEEEET